MSLSVFPTDKTGGENPLPSIFSCWVVRGKGQEAKGLPLRPSSVRGDLTWCFWGTCSSLTHCGCELWAGSQRPRVTSAYGCSALLQGNCPLQHGQLAGPLTRSQALIQQSWNMILMPVSVTFSWCVCVCARVCACFREKGMPRHLQMFDDTMRRPK